jgi:secreted Zn-dependent insulinase-like peptidase
MAQLHYEFQQRNPSIAQSYCGYLRKEPLESFPNLSFQIQKYDPLACTELLSHLATQDPFVTVIAKEAPRPFDRKEKWMGAEYFVDDVAFTTVDRPLVIIPGPNPFIPSELELLEANDSKDVPVCLLSEPGGQLSYLADHEFKVPEGTLFFNIKTPELSPSNAKSQVLARLFVRFVHERLNELSYEASSAGLHYDVWLEKKTGISISIHGYNEKSVLV